jgi:hypothetical protein
MSMFTLLIVCCVLAVAFCSHQSIQDKMKSKMAQLPGKVVTWSNSPAASSTSYVTKSLTIDDLSKQLMNPTDAADSAAPELVVLFSQSVDDNAASAPSSSSSSPCSQHAVLQSAFVDAQQTVFQYVYANALMQSLAESLQTLTAVAPDEALTTPAALEALLSNAQPDLLRISLSPQMSAQAQADTVQSMRALLAQTDKRVVFVAVDQAVSLPLPLLAGHYTDLLDTTSTASSTSTTAYGSPVYSPEGGEYAMYYGGQYLYMTPDIFTGLMTGLFVSFGVAIGLSCLGSIQGMTSFYDKLPAVGKEA